MSSDTGAVRLAPVTYLFGKPEQDRQADVAAPAPEKAARQQERPAPVATTEPRDAVAALAEAVKKIDESHAQLLSDRAAKVADREDRAAERGKFEPISNVSMYALARRGMSSQEMRQYLLGREFDEQEVELELERLESVQLLDDDALAETLVRTLRDRKGMGRSGLNAELRRRNIDPSSIEQAMGSSDDDELERATAVAIKRAPQVRALDSTTAKRRLSAFLMRKGYSGSVVSTAVQRALAPQGGPTFR